MPIKKTTQHLNFYQSIQHCGFVQNYGILTSMLFELTFCGVYFKLLLSIL